MDKVHQKTILPIEDSQYDLGSADKSWSNVYADNLVLGGGGILPVQLKNVAGTIINPATEDKQDTLITAVGAVSGLVDFTYDNILVTYPIDTTEVYTFKTGSTVKGVITIVYTDATKSSLLTVVKS